MGLERYVEQEGSQQSDRCKTIANYQTVQLLPLYKTFLRHNWSLWSLGPALSLHCLLFIFIILLSHT